MYGRGSVASEADCRLDTSGFLYRFSLVTQGWWFTPSRGDTEAPHIRKKQCRGLVGLLGGALRDPTTFRSKENGRNIRRQWLDHLYAKQ